jgi:hypothetical protein
LSFNYFIASTILVFFTRYYYSALEGVRSNRATGRSILGLATQRFFIREQICERDLEPIALDMMMRPAGAGLVLGIMDISIETNISDAKLC